MLKGLSIFMLFLFTCTSSLMGQDYFDFHEENITIEGKNVPILMTVLDGDEDKIQKELLRFISDKTSLKLKRGSNFWISKEGDIYQIDSRGQIIAVIYPDVSGVKTGVAVKLGPDIYIDSTLFKNEQDKLKELLSMFSYSYMYQELVERLENNEKELEAQKKLLEKTSSENYKIQNKIGKLEQKIEVSKAKGKNEKLVKLELELKSLRDELSTLSQTLMVLETDIAKNEAKGAEMKMKLDFSKLVLEKYKI